VADASRLLFHPHLTAVIFYGIALQRAVPYFIAAGLAVLSKHPGLLLLTTLNWPHRTGPDG